MTATTRKERRIQENEKKAQATRRRVISTGALVATATGMFSAVPAAQAASVPDTFTISGSGWGHGVGMSQYGARGMAQEGYSAKQILEHYYNPAQVVSSNAFASSDIKVQLVKTGSASITPSNGRLRVRVNGGIYETSGTVTVQASGSNVAVQVNGSTFYSANVGLEWQGTRYWPGGSATTVTIPGADAESGTGTYRHGKIDVNNIGGQVNLVNTLRLNDEYLYGLAEVPSSWEPAALQAQAIAGRTYAMRNMGYLKPACSCNVYDEVASQKFTGWKKENEGSGAIGQRWKSAVDATQAKSNGVPTSASVVTYNGSLIEAVYSSSTGGKTRSGQSVWVTNTPYLQSREDHWALKSSVGNPNGAWSYTVSQRTAAANFGLGDVASVSIVKNADGTIASATARSSSGATRTISGGQFMSVFPARAHWINSMGNAASPAPAPTGPAIGTAKATTDVNMRSGMGTGYTLLQVVPNGATVTVYGSSAGWTQVSYNGKNGYIFSEYLTATTPTATPAPAPAPSTSTITSMEVADYKTTIQLNLRSGPSTGHSILGSGTTGTTVKGTGRKSGIWYEVKMGTTTGWMSSEYLTKVASAPAPAPAPVATAPATQYKTTIILNLRSGPGLNYNVIGSSPTGTTVTGTGKINGIWYEVKAGNQTGWMSSEYLSKVASTPAPAPVVTTPAVQYKTTIQLNLRSGAGLNYSIIGSSPTGTTVTGTGKTSGIWYEVKAGNQTGWMSSEYLTKVSSTAAIIPASTTPAKAPAATPAPVQYKTTIILNMRSGAGCNYGVTGVGATGTTVTGTGKTSNGWVEVKMGNQTGWMHSDYLEKVGTTATKTATAYVNMRNAAGLNGQILQVVPVNAKVEVKSVSGSWTNVSYNGKTGWISNAYLK
jgi:SpoIID/LytB domain protein